MRRSSELIEAETQFYAWKPPGSYEKGFRCHHISSKPRMTENMCGARARKPEKYADKYRELEKTGFAGEEQRINWLDALRNANARAELFGINYQIGVQPSLSARD